MDDIILEHTYAYAIENVWEALTDPASLADWLMPGDFRPIVGHRVTLHCDPRPDFDGTVEVEILEAVKPTRLSYHWKTSNMKKPSTVTFILTPTPGGGTHLRLEHTGFEGEIGRMMSAMFGSGWGQKLGSLIGPVIARAAGKTAAGEGAPHTDEVDIH
jgi:uncharacterized protein YndB with AHSA1/START domain